MSGYVTVTEGVYNSTSEETSATATCPDGTKVIGGGYRIEVYGGPIGTKQDYPSSESGWTVTVIGRTVDELEVTAICASVD